MSCTSSRSQTKSVASASLASDRSSTNARKSATGDPLGSTTAIMSMRCRLTATEADTDERHDHVAQVRPRALSHLTAFKPAFPFPLVPSKFIQRSPFATIRSCFLRPESNKAMPGPARHGCLTCLALLFTQDGTEDHRLRLSSSFLGKSLRMIPMNSRHDIMMVRAGVSLLDV